MTYEVGLSRMLRAFHVMPGMPGPEGERHHHDYRIEMVVERRDLDERAMVCDLDLLEAALADLAGRIEGKDLEDAIQPSGAEGITVEVFARWAHETLADVVRRAGGETLALRVWESPTAFGGYRAAVGG
ncbi:MAG: 6-carboxytetrahydropterin synthase [Streptosporangiaceae bacterium]|nr:6-carboxytetrahydropterin synthase [Streptosporangiaceae bacterium]